MVYHGIPWYTMVYGVLRFTMVNHGKLWYQSNVLRHGRTMVYHGKTVVYHGKRRYDRDVLRHGRTTVLSRYTVAYYGTPWYTMLTSSDTMVNYGTTVCTMVYHLVYNGIPSMVYTINGIPWYTVVPKFTIVSQGVTMVYHGKPW